MNTRLAFCAVVSALAAVGCNEEGSVWTPPPAPVTGSAAGTGTAGRATAGTGAAGTGAAGTAAAGTGAPVAAGTTDYSKAEHWLCRPGHNEACATDLSSTVVAADGTLTVEPYEASATPPIDCFYVYPTISMDTTPNSDLIPGPEEKSVVQSQFARLGSQCRLFAPVYRQVTLTSLRATIGGMAGAPMPDRTLGYKDVLAAWQYYLDNDNQGRGVVFVSHSQGSSVLTQLLKEKLDTAPLDKRLISALLIGTTITVPKGGAVVGGTFQNVPLCKTAEELGCVISYASFRATMPPSATTLFARSADPNLVGGCTNPAALGGGSGELHAYLTAKGSVLSSAPTPPWVTPEQPVTTPYVSVPGLLTAECVPGMTGEYLSVTINGNPADPRVDNIVGDVLTATGEPNGDWGLHVVDVNLAMGNLVDIVKAKAAAYTAAAR